jgi:hypothetical protein
MCFLPDDVQMTSHSSVLHLMHPLLLRVPLSLSWL